MKKVVIIGGGVAGLTAGIYCRKNGIRCEIFEKNRVCGGNLTGWYREGCYIDNCFHWLVGTNPRTDLYRIWRDIGMITDAGELYQPSVFYESVLDGSTIAFSRYPELTRLNMLKLSLADSVEIDRFIDSVEAVGEFIEKGIPSPALVLAYKRYRGITLGDYSKKFKHPLLKLAFTDYFGESFSAIALVWAYGAFISGNGMVPRGGSKQAAERIENAFIGLGGKIRRSCGIKKLIVDGERASGVITEDGEFFSAQAVICACDPAVIFGGLLTRERMPRGFSRIYSDLKAAPRFSSVQAAFICPLETPRFGTRIISCPEIGDGVRLVVKEYGHEKSFAPNGQSIVQTMLFVKDVECLTWIKLKSEGTIYKAEKARMAQAMRLAVARMLDVSEEAVTCIDSWTPATYNSYFGADHGSYMGFILTPQTPFKRYSCHVRGLYNVFMASQWQCSPGGLPNAARSGRAAAREASKIILK